MQDLISCLGFHLPQKKQTQKKENSLKSPEKGGLEKPEHEAMYSLQVA